MKKILLCLMLILSMNVFSNSSQKDETLFDAITYWNLEALKKGLANGADVNAQNHSGQTVLCYAIEKGQKKMVELLLANNADVNAQNQYGRTPLYYAIEDFSHDDNVIEMVELLLNHGVDVNAIVYDEKKLTPLLMAVKSREKELVELLLKCGANRNAVDINGITVFDWAKFDMEIAQLLSMNVFSQKEEALFRAIDLMDLEAVKEALANGADVNVANNSNDIPLVTAERKGHIETIKLLLDHGAKIDAINMYGERILHSAVNNNHIEIVELLLARGADVNAKDRYGSTALHQAASYEHIAIAQLLLANGADVNAKNMFGKTALYEAIKSSYFQGIRSVKMVELLLDHGVGVNAVVCDEKNLTPLLCAVIERQKEIVKLLLKLGADRNAKDIDGNTALYWAKYDPEIARLL